MCIDDGWPGIYKEYNPGITLRGSHGKRSKRMNSREEATPEGLHTLVARFREHADAYRQGRYNETQLRRDFLDS